MQRPAKLDRLELEGRRDGIVVGQLARIRDKVVATPAELVFCDHLVGEMLSVDPFEVPRSLASERGAQSQSGQHGAALASSVRRERRVGIGCEREALWRRHRNHRQLAGVDVEDRLAAQLGRQGAERHA